MGSMARAQAFWDEDTLSKRDEHDPDDLCLYGTVTTDRAVVRLRDRLEKAHLRRLVDAGPGSRVLDLGGGAGRIALWLAPRVAEVVLVDASRELLDVARDAAARRGVTNLKTLHGSALDFRTDEPFDVVLALNIACHLDDEELGLLGEVCAAATKPDGVVVLKEPVTTDGVGRADLRPPDYQCFFRPREQYPRALAEHLGLVSQAPTCAHFFPWFMRGGTDDAVGAARSPLGATLLEAAAPALVAADPVLREAERAIRASSAARVLAPVEVVQDFYVFRPRRHDATGVPELSVVVIAYNEVECLVPVTRELVAALEAARVDFEVVVVDDGSDDGTGGAADELAAADPRVVAVHQRNLGIGGALRTGFDAARGAAITWVPADGQIGPDVVVELFRRRDEAAMLTTVYRTRDDPWYRTVVSKTLNTMIRVRAGQVAKSGGSYLFHRSAWERYGPRDDDSMMVSTAFRQRLREAGEPIVEVEIDCRARRAGSSKVLNARTIYRTLVGLAATRRSA